MRQMALRAHLPFRGLSAWFSCSVNPKVIRNWDHYGGTYAGETTADYLFSDDAQAQDTHRAYSSQQGVVVFQTSWIKEVIQRKCQVHDVALGQHLLCPHYLAPMETGHDKFTPAQASLLLNSRNAKDASKTPALCAADNATGKDEQIPKGRESSTSVESEKMWSKLEKTASKSKMADVVHIDHSYANTCNCEVQNFYDFDCSKPEFQIKRIK